MNKEMMEKVAKMPYKEFVQCLVKPGDQIASSVNEVEFNLYGSALALFTSTGMNVNNIMQGVMMSKSYDLAGGESKRWEMRHMVGLMAGECGELIDPIKRVVIYRSKIFDKMKDGKSIYENILEELGDILFAITAINNIIHELAVILNPDIPVDSDEFRMAMHESREAGMLYFNEVVDRFNDYLASIGEEAFKITIDSIITANKKKLSKRFESLSYSDEAAKERKDK